MLPYNPPTAGRKGMLRLDFNENTIGCSPKVLERLNAITAEDLAAYPEYSLFGEKLGRYLELDTSQVLPTNGTDEAIKCIIDTYLEKGDEILIPTPTYSMFRIYAEIAEAKIRYVLYNQDLTFPIERILKTITDKTRLVVLVNPNNPTGTPIPRKEIIQVIKKTRNGLVLVDEAYCQYQGESCKDLIATYKNLIVIQTFSKVFGLAGIRTGYILSSKENITNLAKVRSPYSINTLGTLLASAALEDKEFVKKYVAEITKSKALLIKELAGMGLKAYPSSANFILANFDEKYTRIYNALKKENILVRDVSRYPLLKNCLRITLGTLEQTNYFITSLKNICARKCLLFDLDGVLVDVSNSYRLAIKKTAEYFLGENVDEALIQEFKNRGGYNNDWDLTEAILVRTGKKIAKKKIIQKFQEYYLGRSYDGLIRNEQWLLEKSILARLAKKYVLGIVTGRPRKEALWTLAANKVMPYFSCIIAREDTLGNEKPSSYPIESALMKLTAINGIYVGDCVDDYVSALRARIQFIGVIPPGIDRATEMRVKDIFSKKGTSTILQSVNQLSEMLL